VEGPGLIAAEAAAAGIELEPIRLWAGDPLPRPDALAGLVVMGGPMSVNDGAAHPWIEPEVELLASALEVGLPILGVCLGAQLLARALGAAVRPGREQEVGPGSVELTDAGRRDPLLGPCGEALEVFHWHGEGFELPAGRASLAASDRYPNQAFRAGARAWALQFHVEVDEALLAAWRPWLPAAVEIDGPALAGLERQGRELIARFFAEAATR
jgi:GMP synthase-like glutamine amidotransferase